MPVSYGRWGLLCHPMPVSDGWGVRSNGVAPRAPLMEAWWDVLHMTVAPRIVAVGWAFGVNVALRVRIRVAEHVPTVGAVVCEVPSVKGAVVLVFGGLGLRRKGGSGIG
jgi:hypothetical protein